MLTWLAPFRTLLTCLFFFYFYKGLKIQENKSPIISNLKA